MLTSQCTPEGETERGGGGRVGRGSFTRFLCSSSSFCNDLMLFVTFLSVGDVGEAPQI